MKEREISLIDLFVEILLRWRVVVIAMLVGGILLGGVSYVQSVRLATTQRAELAEAEKQLATQKEQLEKEQLEKDEESVWKKADRLWLEEQLTETQIANVNAVLLNEKLLNEKTTYQNESVLMQIDPFYVPRTELTFYISSDDLEKTYNIEKVYEDILTSTALYTYVQEKGAVEANLNELISLERSSYGQMQGCDTVRVAVLHSDEAICQSMANAIIEYVQQQQPQLERTLGSHDVELLSQSFGTVMSTDILTQQRNCATDINNLSSAAMKLRDTFVEAEWRYYNYLKEGQATVDPEHMDPEADEQAPATDSSVITLPTVTTPGVSMTYVILGMILFAFVYVFVIFMMYIFNNKLRSTDSLQDIYSIPQLGIVSGEQKKKKFLGIIDEWILKLRYRNQRRFTAEEATNLATVATKIAVKKQGINKVCLMGCNLAGDALNTCEQIKARLSAEGTEIQILSNVLYDAEVMEELADAQGAVLVETVGSTLYEEIVKELELLNRQNITVLGGIVVE